jgi:hypothetical protein
MSIAGILSGGLGLLGGQSAQSTAQKLKQGFQHLGQDLTAGNLSAAQSDFAALQQNGPQPGTTAAASTNTTHSASPITQAFQRLSQDLKAGNLSAAQSDYATLQQDFQSRATPGRAGHHHHLRDSGSGGSGQSQSNAISTLFNQLGTALQAGNLTAAQTAYSTLQSDFEQFAQSDGLSTGLAAGTAPGSGSSGISINA